MSVGTIALGVRGRIHRSQIASVISVVLSVAFLLLLLVAAVAPRLLAPGDPLAVNASAALQAPGLDHVFGTDVNGRDIYTRVVHGAAKSLTIGVLSTLLAVFGAALLGVAAALGGRAADAFIGRFIEILFAVPGLLIGFVLMAMFGTGMVPQIIAVGLGSVPGYARLVRGQVVSVRAAGYVEAARVQGHSGTRILAQHILPNAFRPLIVMVTLGIGQSIVWAATYSFLGLGVVPPDPEWGAMLSAGRNYITVAWWVEIMPGAVIVATTLATAVLGRYLDRKLSAR